MASANCNMFIGNLSYQTTEADLREAFQNIGCVESVKIITDRDTGQSRGFAFVEMSSPAEAQSAITGMDGYELDGRSLRVNEATPKEDRGSGGYRSNSRGAGGRRH